MNNNTTPHVSIDFEAVDYLPAEKTQPSPPSGPATAAAIPFPKKAKGYDQELVDKYLQKLMSEYNNLQQSYIDLSARYKELAGRPSSNMDAIAKALVEAEARAMKIVADAKAEASRITRGAHQDLTLIQNERTRLRMDINGIVNRLQSLEIGA